VVVTVGGQASNGVAFTVTPSLPISVSLTPVRGGATITQQIRLTATVTNDVGSAGVSWTVSPGGTLSRQTSTTANFSAATAGTYTVTATSKADNTKSASATFGVTNLTGVFTYHNDLARDGSNTSEYALTTSNVNSTTFGKLFSCQTDGAIYTQPLWVANLRINGARHNVVFVATQHESLYAFDADASPCVQLWHVNLIDSTHGGTSGETSVPSSGSGALVGSGFGDITPEVGVTGTPVIDDPPTTLYVVSKSVIVSGPTFFQRLHAIDITTGNERPSSPKNIDSSISVAGTAPDSTNGRVAFNPRTENQRPALALYNGVVYVSWASHEDKDPYHGWLIGFSASNLAIVSIFNTTPNQVGTASYARGGIWMSGGAPAVDSNGYLYCITGNGTFDANVGGSNYGDSILKFNTTSGLTVADYFTPLNQASLDANDADFGGGAATILVDEPSSLNHPHLVVGGGKNSTLFVMNRDSLGKFSGSTNNVVQTINPGNQIFATPVFWQGNLYLAAVHTPMQQFVFSTSTGQFAGSPSSVSDGTYGFPGSTPSLSSNGSSDAILWALENTNYCTTQSPGCGPAVLHAYDATNLATELWNSSQDSGNAAGNAVKFTVPTIANGKVYVGTRGNNIGGTTSSTSVPGELDVYGLLPH
jgi:hypothetical protein